MCIRDRGESVWLGWFLYATLLRFAPLARARAEHEREELWLAHAAALRKSLEREAVSYTHLMSAVVRRRFSTSTMRSVIAAAHSSPIVSGCTR